MSSEQQGDRSPPVDYIVVIPTIGRAGLADLVAGVDAEPRARAIVVVDDRPDPISPLSLPATRTPLHVVRSGGRGPAAARNAGWRAAESEWVAFLDDDVVPAPDWNAQLVGDLAGLPEDVAGSQARLHVPLPPGRRPTDEERRTTGLAGAPWITADMAYRRSALARTGGFDERFPRAFREDTDLALRMVRAGFTINWGRRSTTHPLVARGGWRGVLRAQAGNADNALLRAKYGRDWRRLTKAGPGRTGRHLLTCGAIAAAGIGVLTRRRRVTLAGTGLWAALTAEFAVRRILPGPRTAREIATMIFTSVLIPPLAIGHRLRGELRWRLVGPRRRGGSDSRPRAGARAVLVPTAATLLSEVDRAGVLSEVVPNLTVAVRRSIRGWA